MEPIKIFERVVLVIFLIIGTLALAAGVITAEIKNKPVKTKTTTVKTIETIPQILEVSGTVYNPVADQCDGSPLHTADGSYIDTALLKAGKLRWLAVSQDLLQMNGGPYNLGDTLFVYHPDDNVRGEWIIHDCMNPRVKRYLDFLQPVGAKFPSVMKHLLISNKKFYD